ncbi:MAG: hypothetical protein CME55_00545 [Halieaceae bacterium]|nr:hypothetical protein [Halieaceae bacterium]
MQTKNEAPQEEREASSPKNIHLLVACEFETANLTEQDRDLLELMGITLIMTGVGTLNACMAAMKSIAAGADYIINIGTAGSHTFPVGTVIQGNGYIKRDVDATLIMRSITDEEGKLISPNFPKFRMPYENDIVLKPERLLNNTGLDQGLVFTGDNTHGHTEVNEDYPAFACVEMEAYAIAKVCIDAGIPFDSFKFISDGAGESVGEEWNQNADSIPWSHLLIEIAHNWLLFV